MVHTYRSWSNEDLIDAVKKSDNISEVIRKLGLMQAGGNYSTVNKWVKLLGLDTTHFHSKKKPYKGLSEDEIFIIGSRYPTYRLKKRMIEAGISYECSNCELTTWMGKDIRLQVHHKNGINDDHRKENLTFLCPNCHSQTDIYAGRNKTKTRQ